MAPRRRATRSSSSTTTTTTAAMLPGRRMTRSSAKAVATTTALAPEPAAAVLGNEPEPGVNVASSSSVHTARAPGGKVDNKDVRFTVENAATTGPTTSATLVAMVESKQARPALLANVPPPSPPPIVPEPTATVTAATAAAASPLATITTSVAATFLPAEVGGDGRNDNGDSEGGGGGGGGHHHYHGIIMPAASRTAGPASTTMVQYHDQASMATAVAVVPASGAAAHEPDQRVNDTVTPTSPREAATMAVTAAVAASEKPSSSQQAPGLLSPPSSSSSPAPVIMPPRPKRSGTLELAPHEPDPFDVMESHAELERYVLLQICLRDARQRATPDRPVRRGHYHHHHHAAAPRQQQHADHSSLSSHDQRARPVASGKRGTFGATTAVPRKNRSVIRTGFAWRDYPALEAHLDKCREKCVALQFSAKSGNPRTELDDDPVVSRSGDVDRETLFNFYKNLVAEVQALARQQRLHFAVDLLRDNAKPLRDRIRCYYKTWLQNVKKRIKTMQRNCCYDVVLPVVRQLLHHGSGTPAPIPVHTTRATIDAALQRNPTWKLATTPPSWSPASSAAGQHTTDPAGAMPLLALPVADPAGAAMKRKAIDEGAAAANTDGHSSDVSFLSSSSQYLTTETADAAEPSASSSPPAATTVVEAAAVSLPNPAIVTPPVAVAPISSHHNAAAATPPPPLKRLKTTQAGGAARATMGGKGTLQSLAARLGAGGAVDKKAATESGDASQTVEVGSSATMDGADGTMPSLCLVASKLSATTKLTEDVGPVNLMAIRAVVWPPEHTKNKNLPGALPHPDTDLHAVHVRMRQMGFVPRPVTSAAVSIVAVLHELVRVRLARSLFRSALVLCHNTMLEWYRSAHTQTDMDDLSNVRDLIATGWCMYAHVLMELAVAWMQNNNDKTSDSISTPVVDWKALAVAALATALQCPLAGNHASITVSMARLLVLPGSAGVNLSGKSLNLVRDNLRIAIDVCWDGLDRVHIKDCAPRVDLGTELKAGLYRLAELPTSASDTVAVQELHESIDNLLDASKCPKPASGARYLLPDQISAKHLCDELNRLSKFLQYLDAKCTEQAPITMVYGETAAEVEAFPLFRAMVPMAEEKLSTRDDISTDCSYASAMMEA